MRYRLFITLEVKGHQVIIRSHAKSTSQLATLFNRACVEIKAGKLVSAEAWDWQERVMLHSA